MSQKVKKPTEKDDLESVLSIPAGRRFVHALVSVLDVEPTTSNVNQTYFELGQQAKARLLLKRVVRDHYHYYKLMMAEQHEDEVDSSCNTRPDEQ